MTGLCARSISRAARERMLAVRDQLTRQGIGEAASLQIFKMTLAGRLLDDNGREEPAPGN